MINGKRKGANSEREFAKWIKALLNLDFEPKRNYAQAAEGGADIINVGNFRIEVKRCEKLALRAWWVQVCHGAGSEDIPVVAYRQNRKMWRLLVSAKLIGLKHGFIILEPYEAAEWLEKEWTRYLKSLDKPQ